MLNRWKRACALALLSTVLVTTAGNAEEVWFATPEEPEAAEQRIDPGTLPENIRLFLETAVQEIGYTEGTDGYNKYGAWAGDPYSEWCAEFICWCIQMTDKQYGYGMLNDTYPYYTGQNTGRDWFVSRGRFVYRRGFSPGWGWQWLKDGSGMMQANGYIPRPGDLAYFSYNSAGDTVHVALVEYCAYAADGGVNIHVIEGNNPASVKRSVYSLDNSQVLGFGCWGDVVDTTMQYGDTGDKVLFLQQSLGRLGYLTSRNFTATYASNTRSAVVAFQQTMPGKTPTGVADRETQLAIDQAIEKLEQSDPDSWLVTDGN